MSDEHKNTKHGHARRVGVSKEYGAWRHMLSRCTNINDQKYQLYGGRGIKVCEEWLFFEDFLADIGVAPSNEHSLDRIDVNGDYNKTNCRWATAKEQAQNRRNSLTFDGQPLKTYCEKNGINYHTIITRTQRGYTLEQAIKKPINKKLSKGAQELLDIVGEIFPNQLVVLEHNVAEKGALFLDIYLPQLGVAFEYDGEFHSIYSEHFHGSLDAFRASKKRDAQKTSRCRELAISLVRVRYDEEITKDLVLSKLQQALDNKEDND